MGSKNFVFLTLICILLLAVLYSGLGVKGEQIGAGTAADPAYYFSTTNYMSNGAFRTYVSINHDTETPVGFGLEISKSFFFDTPYAGEGHYTLYSPIPVMAEVYTPFQGFETNWVPGGHPGTPYGAPHMDFHFYLQNKPYRDQNILPGTCGEVSAEAHCAGVQPLTALCCPPGYINPRITVPGMGSHLLDLEDPALNGQPFTATTIYGTYAGRITFYEPMVTIASLESVANGTLPQQCWPMKSPQRHATAGYYPTQYCYYATPNNLRVEMNNFLFIEGGCGDLETLGSATCGYNAAGDKGITMNLVRNCNNCPWFKYTKEMANDK